MRPVIAGTKARELAGSELQIMEEAHELAGLVLERHSGDFSQAAEELWPRLLSAAWSMKSGSGRYRHAKP